MQALDRNRDRDSTKLTRPLCSATPSTQTKSVRMGFWTPHKKLLVGLRKGRIESVSKPDHLAHLARTRLADVQSEVLGLDYLRLNFAKAKAHRRNVLTVTCPASVWFVNVAARSVVGGGRLDRRLRKHERVAAVFAVHEGRVLCAFTSESRALLLLVREGPGTVELVFLEAVELDISGVAGHSQFGK